ncbi:hypothetical protein CHS0354_042862 [Potamilus streckersoni]|uniref:Uncharacterized protein n=1 Tax=Potamilus streckersoni TaxID=2493646 RepID=A0AAE0W7E6_9BIVA|nr:hypothetical protein CHS0354_042862 [Potamilus streckersoni]
MEIGRSTRYRHRGVLFEECVFLLAQVLQRGLAAHILMLVDLDDGSDHTGDLLVSLEDGGDDIETRQCEESLTSLRKE